jgi:hypothetical protein
MHLDQFVYNLHCQSVAYLPESVCNLSPWISQYAQLNEGIKVFIYEKSRNLSYTERRNNNIIETQVLF